MWTPTTIALVLLLAALLVALAYLATDDVPSCQHSRDRRRD